MPQMNKNTNYIVSGLERSGTSLMMQILEAGGVPVVYDNLRKPDMNNPKGYYELNDGKVIDKLLKKSFPMDKYKGKFIKITAYGLNLLPKGKYDVIYMIRNTDEIVESTIKMGKNTYDRDSLRECLVAFDKKCLDWLSHKESNELHYIPIFYNALLDKSTQDAELGIIQSRYNEFDTEKAKKVIDDKLYRNKSKFL